MIYFIIIFESILYLISTTVIQYTLHDCDIKRNLFFYSTFLVYILLICFAFNNVQRNAFSIISILLNFLIMKIALKNIKFKQIIYTYVFLYSINISLSSVFMFITNQSNNIPLRDFSSFVITLITLISWMFICKVEIFKFSSYYKLIPSNVMKIICVSIVSSCFVISSFSESKTFENVIGWTTGTRISLLVFILFIGAVIPVLIFTSIGSSLNLNKSKEFEKRINIQSKHYRDLAVAIHEFRLFRHDYKNNFITFRQALENRDVDKALDYLHKNDEEINYIINDKIKFDTGSGSIDAVLVVKQSQAEKINAKIEFEGSVSIGEEYISTGLTVLLGNALDNAIEACEKITGEDTKIIKVCCDCRGSYMFLKITNPVAEDIKIRNNKILPTTKEDKKNHGIGMQSMLGVVRKYNGTLNISCENKMFCLEVDLDVMDYDEKRRSLLGL